MVKKKRLKRFNVTALVEFKIGAPSEAEAEELAECAMFFGVQRYSYGDICVAEIGGAWHSDDTFEDVGIKDREGYEFWKREKED